MKSKIKDLPKSNLPEEEIIPLEEKQQENLKTSIRTTINQSSKSKRTSK
jgi:hypothetical protein